MFAKDTMSCPYLSYLTNLRLNPFGFQFLVSYIYHQVLHDLSLLLTDFLDGASDLMSDEGKFEA